MPPPKRTSGLGRPSTGLTRYYLDVGWWRHPRFAALPAEALIVWQACVGYSVEHATDGVIPNDPETLAAAVGLKLSWVRKALPKLEEAGQIGSDSDGNRIVIGYAEHNPTAAEIKAYTEERSDLGRKGNHERWHVSRGVSDPQCPLCRPKSDPVTDRSSDRSSDSQGSHGMGSNGLSSSSPPPATPAPTRPNGAASGGEEETREQFIERTLTATFELMAQQTLAIHQAEGHTVHNRTGWLRTTTTNLAEQHRTRALHEIEGRTTGRYYPLHVELAEALDPRCGPEDGGRARAEARRVETLIRLTADQGAA